MSVFLDSLRVNAVSDHLRREYFPLPSQRLHTTVISAAPSQRRHVTVRSAWKTPLPLQRRQTLAPTLP